MSVLDEVLEKAKTAADYAGKKTSEWVELSKLKYSESQIKGQIKTTCQKLGQTVYDQKKAEQNAPEGEAPMDNGMADQCINEIDTLLEELDDVKKKIADLRHLQLCPNCKADNDDNAVFCSKCGTKLRQE